ncbi:unnamed protein product [Darwinula stevensoni]|uniref:Uncharacterized protein n=1 Tax=Darwinula stevensoni TaxID=69355 RepID=A0A7R8ZXE9_9CRUS|nr:unnamed protein product [Darwinula stevensoni]CAG0878501.1 unnamed protein product [Darwinula stevensoni]
MYSHRNLDLIGYLSYSPQETQDKQLIGKIVIPGTLQSNGCSGKRMTTEDILEFTDLLKLGHKPIPVAEQKKITSYKSCSSPFFDPGCLSLDDGRTVAYPEDIPKDVSVFIVALLDIVLEVLMKMMEDYQEMAEKVNVASETLVGWGVDCIPLPKGGPSLQVSQLRSPQLQLYQNLDVAKKLFETKAKAKDMKAEILKSLDHSELDEDDHLPHM